MSKIIGKRARAALIKNVRGEDRSVSALQTVLLIDDIPITRQSLAHVLATRAQDWLVTSVACVAEAADLKPNLVLWYLRSKRTDAPDIAVQIEQIRSHFDAVPLVAICDLDDIDLAREALRRQFRGYLPTNV